MRFIFQFIKIQKKYSLNEIYKIKLIEFNFEQTDDWNDDTFQFRPNHSTQIMSCSFALHPISGTSYTMAIIIIIMAIQLICLL